MCWTNIINGNYFLLNSLFASSLYLRNLPIFRSHKRQYPNESQHGVYEPHAKGYDGIPLNERDMKPTQQPEIPHYVGTWNKYNAPYISSPTLLTGKNGTCDLDNIQKLPFRDRSLSVGSKEIQRHGPDAVSATDAGDRKTDCEYKPRISWHKIWTH